MYTLYKTINLLNGSFYIGVHKADAPNDSYLGSGVRLIKAIGKYGRANFRKQVLQLFSTATEAFTAEKALVPYEDPNCYNAILGGGGHLTTAWNKGRKMPIGFAEHISATKKGVKRPSHVGVAVARANKTRGKCCWVYKGVVEKKVAVSDLASYFRVGWSLGRPSACNIAAKRYSRLARQLRS